MMKSTKRKVTMTDIAARLGISKNSVSLALNNKLGVSADLRRKIIVTAEEMSYQAHTVKSLPKSKCIVLLSADYLRNDAFFYADIFWSIEKEAKIRGCIAINVSISPQAEHDCQMPDLPEDMEIAGILVIGIIQHEYLEKLLEMGIPAVSVDILYHNLHITGISTSNVEGGYIAGEYLIKKGHTNIGFIGPVHTAQSVYERWCGFYQAMTVYGIPIKDEYNIIGRHGAFELYDTVSALEPYYEKVKNRPTAWFCAGDRIAAALISLLSRDGIRVPADVSVMGFDDIPLSQMIYPQLTTVRVDRVQMGRLAVENLLSRKHSGTVSISLSGTLVERDSVRQSTEVRNGK